LQSSVAVLPVQIAPLPQMLPQAVQFEVVLSGSQIEGVVQALKPTPHVLTWHS
jgi:hypothetical protein